jgi:hypothetical protein
MIIVISLIKKKCIRFFFFFFNKTCRLAESRKLQPNAPESNL